MLHLTHMLTQSNYFVKEGVIMTLTQKRLIVLTAVILAAAISGRLAVRGFMNLVLGGTMFGGNFL